MRRRWPDSTPRTPLEVSGLRYCEIKAGALQPATVRHCRYTILSFVRFLDERFGPMQRWSQLRRHPQVEDWLRSLQPLRPATRSKYVQTLGQFFDDLREWQWPDPPEEGLLLSTDVPRLPQCYPQPLVVESDRRLREALQTEPSVLNLGLLLLRETGLRVGELLALPLDAARLNRNGQWDLKVPLGKTQTERIFPLMPQALGYLQALGERRGRQVPGTARAPRLLVDEQGRAVTYFMLQRHLKRVAERIGLPEGRHIHPHQLRHTFATELARTGIPLPSLMRLLGHRRPNVTMQYVELNGTDVRLAYEQAASRFPLLSALAPSAPLDPTLPLPPQERLALFLTSLERERRDLPANDPQAESLRRLVRKLQALIRTMRK